MKVLILILSICAVSLASFIGNGMLSMGNGLDNADNLTDVQEAFIKYGLDAKFPHLPPNKLIVHYNKDTKVQLGTELNLQTIMQAPNVIFEAEPEGYYTLIMVDVDSPTREKPYFGDLLIWKVVNIPGSKIHEGETVAEYSAHAPRRAGETHRYVLLLFKQHQKQIFGDRFQPAFHTFHHRVGFSALKYSMRYRLGRPIAGNFFQLWHRENKGNEVVRHYRTHQH